MEISFRKLQCLFPLTIWGLVLNCLCIFYGARSWVRQGALGILFANSIVGGVMTQLHHREMQEMCEAPMLFIWVGDVACHYLLPLAILVSVLRSERKLSPDFWKSTLFSFSVGSGYALLAVSGVTTKYGLSTRQLFVRFVPAWAGTCLVGNGLVSFIGNPKLSV